MITIPKTIDLQVSEDVVDVCAALCALELAGKLEQYFSQMGVGGNSPCPGIEVYDKLYRPYHLLQ